MVRVSTLAILGAASVEASELAASIRNKITAQAGGPNNCPYKCGLQWNQRNTWNGDKGGGFYLNEYVACVEGCDTCDGASAPPTQPNGLDCQIKCKSEDWPSYAYTFNKAKQLLQVQNDEFQSKKDLKKCLAECLAPWGNKLFPGTKASKNGKLPRKFTRCTMACYDKHLPKVAVDTFNKCHAGASQSCGYSQLNCYEKDECFMGLQKGVVEPDKACIMGCGQNLCQNGAQCLGKGYYNTDFLGDTGCALITSQTVGIRNTVSGNYFGEQSDIGTCCAAAKERCTASNVYGDFYISLGHTIATGNDGSCSTGDGTWYPVITSKADGYRCDCDQYKKLCDSGITTCYGKGGE